MANKGTNTGTGGINIDDKQYGMDVGLPNSEGGAQGQWSAGDVSVDDADFQKDITKPTKETFARYMSKTTLGQAGSSTHRNYYAVGTGDGTPVYNTKLTDEYGYPAKIQETENEEKFSSVGVGVPVMNPEFLKKGLVPPRDAFGLEVPDGNKLLLNAATPAEPGGPYVKSAKELNFPIKQYVSAVTKKNRFNSDVKYFDNYLNTGVRPNDNVPPVIVSQFLKHGVSPGEQEQPAKTYDFNRLAHVGTVLQLAATGEYAAIGGSSTIDPNDLGIAISTLAPGVGQLGAGVPLPAEYLDVKNIINRLTENPVSDGQLTEFGTQFEGVINSSFEKFSGFSSLGMTVLVLALAIVVVVAIEVASYLFPKTSSAVPLAETTFKKNFRLGMGTYSSGKVTSQPEDLTSLLSSIGSSSAMQFFGILPTRLDFFTATTVGVQTTFGLGPNFEPRTTTQSSGYLVTICRAIVRSVTRFFVEFVELGKLAFSGNVGDSFAKALEIISTIKNSRFIRSINVFAQLGDVTLKQQSLAYDVTLNIDSSRKISLIDSSVVEVDSSAFYGRNRLYADKQRIALKLAWTADRAPDVYVIPPHLKKAAFALDGPIYDKRSSSSRARYQEVDITKTRISPDTVAEIEARLEGEYLPFYIQDLRTNEFVSFHAFLTTLADDYTANYDTTEGIGRMDPVRSYKNTTRRVTVGFVLAALDEEDFEGMWEKINKLTTLVYPQYTKGKKIDIDGTHVFEKPFTQMIAASPMVRLRVGNLFTSNYSKFNIAGIFGLFDRDAKIAGAASDLAPAAASPQQGNQQSSPSNSAEAPQGAAESKPRTDEELATIFPGGEFLLRSMGNFGLGNNILKDAPEGALSATIMELDERRLVLARIKIAKPSDYSDDASLTKKVEKAVKFYKDFLNRRNAAAGVSQDPENLEFELTISELYLGAMSTATRAEAIKRRSAVEAKQLKEKIASTVKSAGEAVQAEISNLAQGVKSFLGIETPQPPGDFAWSGDFSETPRSFDTIDEELLKEMTVEKSPPESPGAPPPPSFTDAMKDFLNEKNNAIVRSFRSTGGKGLAGFIESIGFDWNSGTWDVEHGRWAPKVCKINITFAPIHDIAPGLDAYGFNRAPIYPLGHTGKRKIGA